MENQKAANETLREAIRAGQPAISPGTVPGYTPPAGAPPMPAGITPTGNIPAGQPVPGTGGFGPMASVLANANPDLGLGPLAFQLQAQQLQNQQAAAQKQLTTLTPAEVKALGLRPGTTAQRDAFGGLHIAQAPAAPVSLAEGGVLVDPTSGKVVARGPAKPQPGFSLAPGGARFDANGKRIASLPAKPERPLVHAFVEGGQRVDKQWNSTTNRWEPVSGGPRWNPATGSITEPQKANNAEIAKAREQLQSLAMDRQQLHDAITPSDPINPYSPPRDPMIASLVRRALQHKVGDDPNFASMYDYVYGPEPYRPPGASPDRPAASPAPASASGQVPSLLPPGPSVPYTPPIQGNAGRTSVLPIPRTPGGKIDATKLQVGQGYTAPDGSTWTWDGQNFRKQ